MSSSALGRSADTRANEDQTDDDDGDDANCDTENCVIVEHARDNASDGDDDDDDDDRCRMRFDKNGQSLSYYVTLLFAQDQQNVSNTRVTTLIDVTRNPLDDVVDHNHGAVSKHRFAGKNSGSLCKVQQIIGPIDTRDEAERIQSEWKSKSRGLVGRGAQGRALAAKHKKPCWDAHADRIYDRTAKRAGRKKSK